MPMSGEPARVSSCPDNPLALAFCPRTTDEETKSKPAVRKTKIFTIIPILTLSRLRRRLWSWLNQREKQQGCNRAEARARDEGGLRIEPVPQEAHHERGGQHRYAEGKIIQPVSRATLLRPHKVCDERLLRAFSKAKIDSVD